MLDYRGYFNDVVNRSLANYVEFLFDYFVERFHACYLLNFVDRFVGGNVVVDVNGSFNKFTNGPLDQCFNRSHDHMFSHDHCWSLNLFVNKFSDYLFGLSHDHNRFLDNNGLFYHGRSHHNL